MSITATFSNGYTDTYKGKRAVTAAWMITDNATGRVLHSGHSLDRKRAESTARNTVTQLVYGPTRRMMQIHPRTCVEYAKRHGCKSDPRAVLADVAKRREHALAAVTIEVTDI